MVYQFQPRSIRVADQVLGEVFLASGFEKAGVGKHKVGEDAKEWDNVCMRQLAADEGMAMESLYSSDK